MNSILNAAALVAANVKDKTGVEVRELGYALKWVDSKTDEIGRLVYEGEDAEALARETAMGMVNLGITETVVLRKVEFLNGELNPVGEMEVIK